MVSRSRLKSLLTGLALYTMAAAMVGYFGVNAYTGKYGLNARQELDQEIIALTSELARLKRERTEGEQRNVHPGLPQRTVHHASPPELAGRHSGSRPGRIGETGSRQTGGG